MRDADDAGDEVRFGFFFSLFFWFDQLRRDYCVTVDPLLGARFPGCLCQKTTTRYRHPGMGS